MKGLRANDRGRKSQESKTKFQKTIQTEKIAKAEADGAKPRDLEDRTFLFAQSVRKLVKQLPKTISNLEDVRQLVRASGSVAANWIEADEALSKKDFVFRVKICRKEAKESRLFLRLVDAEPGTNLRPEALSAEARELVLIFASIVSKATL